MKLSPQQHHQLTLHQHLPLYLGVQITRGQTVQGKSHVAVVVSTAVDNAIADKIRLITGADGSK